MTRAIYQEGGRARRLRPRGALRHYAGLLSPAAAAGMGIAAERDPGGRLRQATAVAIEGLRERRAPTRAHMRALRAAPGGRMRWHAVPAPAAPGPDAAVVRPLAAATCDLDCAIALGASQFPLPLHLGHECVAEVLRVGERVGTFARGDRVAVPFQINCGGCGACRAGNTGNCTSVPSVSMYGMGLVGGLWGNAFAEELAVPYAEAMLVPLPAGVDPEVAASVSDNICDAYRHFAPHLPRLLQRDADAEILIIGAARRRSYFSPSLPLYGGLIARALGARRVRLADARAGVREHAQRLGIEALHPRELRGLARAPLVVDNSGGDGLKLALERTAPDGVCSSSGSLHRTARVPVLRMYGRNVTLHLGRAHARALMPHVLELIATGKLDPRPVTTTVATFDEAPAALAEHFRSGGAKAVLRD